MPHSPRIPIVTEAQADPAQLELLDKLRLDDGTVLNIFATLANHPDLARRWFVFANHVLAKSTLSPRVRELAILRVGWRCNAEYEWGQHVLIAREVGVGNDEIARLQLETVGPQWATQDACILRATDELHKNQTVSDSVWEELSEHYDVQQRMDLVFAVGQYTLVSMALNTFGVERDEGVPSFADTAGDQP